MRFKSRGFLCLHKYANELLHVRPKRHLLMWTNSWWISNHVIALINQFSFKGKQSEKEDVLLKLFNNSSSPPSYHVVASLIAFGNLFFLTYVCLTILNLCLCRDVHLDNYVNYGSLLVYTTWYVNRLLFTCLRSPCGGYENW